MMLNSDAMKPSKTITKRQATHRAPYVKPLIKPARASTTVLGSRIRERRKELGLGLQALADQTGLTASFLSLVERNLTSPSLDSLIKIAEANPCVMAHHRVTVGRTGLVACQMEERQVQGLGNFD